MHVRSGAVVIVVVLAASMARAQPAPEPPPATEPAPAPVPETPPAAEPSAEPAPGPVPEPEAFELPGIDVHGFVSQGALITNHNDYLGHSRRGSLEFTEAAVNFSTAPTEKLRVGVQLFTRDLGPVGDYSLTLDWAYLDYQLAPELGLRAGRVKLPFGLHNEYSDIDAARLPILLPQAIYPILSRDVLLAQTGFELYGSPSLGPAGSLDYRLYYGTWFIDPDSFGGTGPISIRSVDTPRLAGGQLFWHPPVEELRVGGSFLYSIIDFDLVLEPAAAEALVASGMAPEGFDGSYRASFEPVRMWVLSAEHLLAGWQLAAEYSRWYIRTRSTLAAVTPPSENESERFYVKSSRALADDLEVGAYYAVQFADVEDRDGDESNLGDYPFRAWQKDLALSLRYDLSDSWLLKLEGHFMDGAAGLDRAANPYPKRYWWLGLVKTTVTF